MNAGSSAEGKDEKEAKQSKWRGCLLLFDGRPADDSGGHVVDCVGKPMKNTQKKG